MESEEEEKYCSNCKRFVAANNFAIHSAYCERNILVCKLCDEPVGLTERDNHFDNYHLETPCNLCEASIEKWMLPDHMKICPKRLIVCEYCEAEFPLNEHIEHVEFCGSRTEKCLLCNKYIMMKDKAKHTELHRCEQEFKRKKIEEEIKQNKVNETISSLENSAYKKVHCEDSLRREETRKMDPRTRVGANFEGIKESAYNERSCDSKRMEQDRMQSLQGATALSKEMPSRYGECHICKRMIPWIDMNTHIPSCASLAGKCSLCGEDVPNHAMKDHMRGHYSSNFQMQSMSVPQNVSSNKCPTCDEDVPNHAMKEHIKMHRSDEYRTQSARISESPVSYMRKNSSDRDQNAAKITTHTDRIKSSSVNEYECSMCFEMVNRKDRHRHERDCRGVKDHTESGSTYFSTSVSQSFYECPLCSEKIPEENRQTHISFECKTLLEDHRPCDTFSRSDSSDMYECPLCLALMQEKEKNKHELFECKVLIDNSGVNIPEPESYSNATKKTCQCSCRKKNNSCGKCKSVPQHKMTDYPKPYQQRVACNHCHEMVNFSSIDVHENYCPAKSYKNYSKYGAKHSKSSDEEPKGAVSKKKSLSEMLRPEISQCKYCHTTLNKDILIYHEDQCIHRPVLCPECSRNILVKDLESHDCKKKKKKNTKHREEEQVPVEKNESSFGFKKIMNYMFSPSGNKEKNEEGNIYRQDSWSPRNYNSYSYLDYPQVSDIDASQPFFQDALVPCEFCSKEVLASELVLHETGCQPDLVSYSKQVPSENPNLVKSSAALDRVPSNTKEMKESVTRFNESNMEGMKQPFFSPENSVWTSDRMKQRRKSDTKPGEFLQLKHEKSSSRNSEGIGNKSKGKSEESTKFKSVWNSESYETEDQSDQMSKHSDDPMDVDQFNECTTNMRTTKHERELYGQTSEDGDMKAYLSFLNDDGSNTLDKEYEIESKVEEKRAECKRPNTNIYSEIDSLLKERIQQYKYKECSDERNTNIERQPSKFFKENLRSVAHSCKNEVEFDAALQKLKDLQSHPSATVTHKEIPIKANALEKKDEEPEISSKQNNSLDDSTKIKMELADFKKYLPKLEFASPKKNSSSADGENDDLFAKDEEKNINKMSVYDRFSSEEESADSLKNLANSKFGMYLSSASCHEKNVCKTKEDEKLIKKSHKNISTHTNCSEDRGEKLDEAQRNCMTDIPKHIWTDKEDKKLAGSSYNVTDSEITLLKSKRFSLKNAEHETFLQNVIDDSVTASMEKTARNTASENECISNYKKYFPDFKFAASEMSTISKKDSVHCAAPSKKNLIGASETRYEQELSKTSKHSTCSEKERESASSFNPLAHLEYLSFKSTPCNEETHERKLHEKKDDEPSELHLDKNSAYNDKISENEVQCSNDFRKYLPDFKFGSQITRSSNEKSFLANLEDKKGQFEESTSFKLQSAQLSSNESVDVQEHSMKKIQDLQARIASTKQAQEAIKTEDRVKWNQWRGTPKSSSSDSE